MKINIIGMTENPIDAIASAFAVTRGLTYNEYLYEYSSFEKKIALINGCLQSGHMSGFEFVDIDAEVTGFSRVFEADKIRSRIGHSYEVEAGKYTDSRNLESIIPADYDEHTIEERLGIIRKWNREDAEKGIDPRNRRYWTHQGVARRARIKVNLRALVETGWGRCCSNAQWEYKKYMSAFKAAIFDYGGKNAQSIFISNLITPKCLNLGYCPEVWNPCGRMPRKEDVLSGYKEYLKIKNVCEAASKLK